MKKMIIVVLGLILVVALSGAGLAANASAQGQPQTVCPVLGGKINKDVYTDYKGQRVYFCCPGCVGKFQADPEKYLKSIK
ncbi:MAG: YHS domain-containing protein [Deltaproteobacteria bacterium]|nr:YHS domain-containing protein [Deltaproteobacteria bacterium]